ncbi:MAG: hypothetical protein CML67_08845 [Rhodobacteraceae bacterium]|nr:hypothetical protein [Paracoccaceae bacterium]
MQRRALAPVLLATALAAIPALPVSAQSDMGTAEGGESLFDWLETRQDKKSDGSGMSFDETSVAEHDALACAAGMGCEGLGVNQDDALVLTGHDTADTAREAYREQYGEPLSDQGSPSDGDAASNNEMSFDDTSVAEHDALACAAGMGCEGLGVNQDDALVLTGHDTADTAREAYREQYGEPLSDRDPPIDGDGADQTGAGNEAEQDGSLFDRVETGQKDGSSGNEMSFDDTSVAEHDALACAAGMGCEGLGVNQDDALVLTGHDTADTAREAFREKYGDQESSTAEEATEPDLSVDTKDGDMSFTEDDVTDDGADMSFSEDEVVQDGSNMSFTEEEALDNQDGALPENRFTDADITSFSQEERALWACAAAFGCKGAAAGLTPHQALHRLELPDFSYEWPLAACATNAPGACEEIGISLMDAMRIMSHLANPNR